MFYNKSTMNMQVLGPFKFLFYFNSNVRSFIYAIRYCSIITNNT